MPWPLLALSAWLAHGGACVGLLAVLLALRARRPGVRRAWLGLAALGLGTGLVLLGLVVRPPPAAPSLRSEPVRLLLLNLEQGSGGAEAVLDALARARADVVVLLEVDAAWEAALSPGLGALPHRWSRVRSDRFGVLVASRWPLTEAREEAVDGLPLVRLDVGGEAAWSLVPVHLGPPVSARWAEVQARQVPVLAGLADPSRGAVVVAGDLNLTPWMPGFGTASAGLVSARRGQGWLATWPSWLGDLGIPIDHVLVSPEIVVQGGEVVEAAKGDHRGLLVRLAVPASR